MARLRVSPERLCLDIHPRVKSSAARRDLRFRAAAAGYPLNAKWPTGDAGRKAAEAYRRAVVDRLGCEDRDIGVEICFTLIF